MGILNVYDRIIDEMLCSAVQCCVVIPLMGIVGAYRKPVQQMM